MPLSNKERQTLWAGSHQLKAAVTVNADGLTDAAVAHVRAQLASHPLLKVRIAAETGAACDEAAADLAQRIPCELIKRVGRVALLYQPPTE